MIRHPLPKWSLLVLALWLATASAIGWSGALVGAPAFVIGVTNATLTLGTLVALWRVPSLRRWAVTVPARHLVLFHVTRMVGIAFLVLHARGELADDFALFAGWGDIATALSALAVAYLACPPVSPGERWATGVWNTFGLIDIVLVVATALRLGAQDPMQVAAIARFPMSLLPTFLVPLIIATHLLLFVRLASGQAPPTAR